MPVVERGERQPFSDADSREDWMHRLRWLTDEARAQLPWLEHIDASTPPPEGLSILERWEWLEELHTHRYTPILNQLLEGSEGEVKSREWCETLIRERRDDEKLNDLSEGPSRAAAQRLELIERLEGLSGERWEAAIQTSKTNTSEYSLSNLLQEICEEDRLALRSMSLFLLDRHREWLSQREIEQRSAKNRRITG